MGLRISYCDIVLVEAVQEVCAIRIVRVSCSIIDSMNYESESYDRKANHRGHKHEHREMDMDHTRIGFLFD